MASRCIETGGVKACSEWREDVKQDCKEWKDNGSSQCSSWHEERRRECSAWDDRCCDWWPCSWACKIITWVCVAWAEVSTWTCVAWVWVSNWVCVAYAYVSSWVCVAWKVVTTIVCVLVDAIVTVINAIWVAIESIVGWLLSAIAFVVNLFFMIPVLGRFLRWIWEIAVSIYNFFISLLDMAAWLIGIRPEKKLRVCAVILRDEEGPVMEVSAVVAHLREAVVAYREQANVRVVPTKPFHFTSGFADAETPDESWVTIAQAPVNETILSNLPCGLGIGWTDLSPDGSHLEAQASVNCFFSNWRRLVGYGAPVVVFYVKKMADDSGSVGCSAGPLVDWVVVGRQGSRNTTTAHEIGHACSLWHSTNPSNLMAPATIRVGTALDLHQVLLVRSSRHVTYF